jgi:hypothetical protein
MADAVTKAFEDLFAKFKIDDKVLRWVTGATGLQAKSLADFQFAITVDSAADVMVAAAGITDASAKMLQSSRVRQAVPGPA